MKKYLFTLLLIVAAIGLRAQNGCVSYGYPFWNQPDELNRGRLKFPNMISDHPLTMMDRQLYRNANNGFEAIRQAISVPSAPTGALYQNIYSFATMPMPAAGGYLDKEYSRLAAWAKFNAFIFVIGLDPDNSFKPLDVTDPTGAKRNAFAARAMEAFKSMNYNVRWLPSFANWNPVDLLQFRCRELQWYCQAYDWLKGANADPTLAGRCPLPPGDKDRNSGTCTPRYRLRLFARNFFWVAEGLYGPIESPTGWKKNHGIMAAAAIGTAAIVLHDAGVETNGIKALFDWVAPAPNYSPQNWYHLGLQGYENLLEGKHILGFDNVPQTNADGTAGYAEGPSYFNYAFACFIPFLRANDNVANIQTPFYNREPFTGMFKWAEKVYSAEVMPTYDNSGASAPSLLGLTGNAGYKYGTLFEGGAHNSLYPDYISVMATPVTAYNEEISTLANSGNTYIRGKDEMKDTMHFFHMLHETGIAVDKPVGWSETHEDDDFGSFSLYVNKQLQLAIDPPYFGWDERDKTNKYHMHNTLGVRLTSGESLIEQEFSNSRTALRGNGFSLFYDNKITTYKTTNSIYNFTLQRSVSAFHLANGELYYVLNDYAPTGKGVTWRLNGNGHLANSTYSYDAPARLSTWSNPCGSAFKYKLLHYYAGLDGVNKPISYSTQEDHSKGLVSTNKHTRLVLEQNNAETIIQSVLIPLPCTADLPKVTYDEQPDYVATTVESVTHDKAVLAKKLVPPSTPGSPVTDTLRTTHIAQLANLTLPVADPFKTGALTDILETDAQHASLSMGTYENIDPGPCGNSAIRFKEAVISNGSRLAFNDTDYISCYFPVNASYKFTSKFKYEAYADLNGQTGMGVTVSFYLPDHELGYKMAAKIGGTALPYTYNDTTGLLNVTISAPTKFTVELASPCQADCFFPPTHQPIDTSVVFSTGTQEVLGHDLDIIQDKGEFTIARGSKMAICDGFVFTNKDSLIMHSIDVDTVYSFQNQMDGGATVSTSVRGRVASSRSMIIISQDAALVLDSGSFTHVGDNATILVLKGGTLLVRKGAILEIGGKESSNKKMFGEVIAEEGAYVCIEDSSAIYFYADTPSIDTQDVNVFYVSLNQYTPTIAGTNPLGGRGRFVALEEGASPVYGFEGIYANSACIPFCDLKTYRPLHGINNRDFGWCNFSKPVSRLTFPEYTCEGTDVVLKDFAVLNETSYSLKIYDQAGLFMNKSSTDEPERFKTIKLPALTRGKFYSVTLITKNDCGEEDTIQKSISVPDAPIPSMVLSGTGCQGTGNIFADGSLSASGISSMSHTWYVQRLDSFAYDTFNGLIPDEYTMEWVNDTALQVDSNFNFPGFIWKGGYSYIVGLTIHGFCGDSTITDTIHFALGVRVAAITKPGVYHNPLGPSALQLNGTVSGATSFSWSPTTGLSNPAILNPIATPGSATTYVLTATSGSCTVSDSVVVEYKNHMAYAGDNRVICGGDSIGLGTDYSLAVLLGAAYASHPTQVANLTGLDMNQLSALFTEAYTDSSVILCEALREVLFDEKFLNAVVEHPAFASYYEAFLQDPANMANYAAFANNIAAMNYLYALSQATTAKYNCIKDYLEDLYDLYSTCPGYRRYPDIDAQGALVSGALYYSDPALFSSEWHNLKNAGYLFPAYLAGFIQSPAFSALADCSGLSSLLGNPDLDAVYYEEAGFMEYLDTLVKNPSEPGVLDYFADFVDNTGGPAQDYIITPGIGMPCITEFFNAYRNWANSACISTKTIVWEENSTGTWEHIPQWDGYYNIYRNPAQATDYRVTVVDMATNTIEYDIAKVVTDSALTTFFGVALQQDSTVYFINYTQGLRPDEISYLWVFGDGDSSTLTSPVHTFPKNDTTYIVCLYATNKCGTSHYCDTISIDSLTAASFSFNKKGKDHEASEWTEHKQQPAKLSNKNMLGNNRPNPFNGITEIDYELIPAHSKAQLQIINMLGQESMFIPISSLKGTLQIDASNLRPGMYYYSLIVDGLKTDTRIMIVK